MLICREAIWKERLTVLIDGQNMRDRSHTGYTLIELIITIISLVALVLVCLGIYAAYHFIMKVW